MDTLIEKSHQKARDVDTRFIRSIMNKIDWNDLYGRSCAVSVSFGGGGQYDFGGGIAFTA